MGLGLWPREGSPEQIPESSLGPMTHRLHTKWWVLNISQHSTSISFPDIFWESKSCLIISCSAGTGVRLISCICVSYFCCRPSLVYFPPLAFFFFSFLFFPRKNWKLNLRATEVILEMFSLSPYIFFSEPIIKTYSFDKIYLCKQFNAAKTVIIVILS